MPSFQDIPPYTHHSGYAVDIGLDYLPIYIYRAVVEYGLDMNPDFQRAYVWTPEQKSRYVEHFLRGGQTGRDIWTNSNAWNNSLDIRGPGSWYVLVDGKQRLDALLGFLSNEVPIFGDNYYKDYTGVLRSRHSLKWHVNDLQTRDECLHWYLEINAGGTVHSEEDLEHVRTLLRNSKPYVKPPADEVLSNARLDRVVFVEAIREHEEKVRRSSEKYAEMQTKKAASPVKKKTGTKRGV